MSLIIKKLQPRQILHIHKILSSVRSKYDDYWAPNYVPGPFPKTKEEREAAAKKYNLLPEEYEPYPDDGFGFGDYPKLPYESVTSRDGNYAWDDEELRRNYMEPVHVRIINLLPEQDPADQPVSKVFKDLLIHNLIPVGICFILFYFLSHIHFSHGNKKQYPTPGVVHYTFELDNDKAK